MYVILIHNVIGSQKPNKYVLILLTKILQRIEALGQTKMFGSLIFIP